jgi:hypothetical protein
MRTRALVQPAVRSAIGIVASGNADDVSPHSSAIVGITVLADLEDVLAVLRAVVLFARSLQATLSVNLPGREVLSLHFGDDPCPASLSLPLDSVQTELREMVSTHAPSLILEASVIAASFVSTASISVRVRSANSVPRSQQR